MFSGHNAKSVTASCFFPSAKDKKRIMFSYSRPLRSGGWQVIISCGCFSSEILHRSLLKVNNPTLRMGAVSIELAKYSVRCPGAWFTCH